MTTTAFQSDAFQITTVWPDATDVLSGLTYGPDGDNYTGTLSPTGGTCPTASEIANAVGQRIVEGTLSMDAILRLVLSAVAGRSVGVGTSIETYKSVNGAIDRLVVTFDSNNNRIDSTLNGS